MGNWTRTYLAAGQMEDNLLSKLTILREALEDLHTVPAKFELDLVTTSPIGSVSSAHLEIQQLSKYKSPCKTIIIRSLIGVYYRCTLK